MKETQRIASLFEELYDGTPWIDVSIAGTLTKITAEEAAAKVLPGRNSIWEIVNHLVCWRENVLQRVNGEVLPPPENNYFMPVADVSELAWKNTLKRFEASQQQWISFLENFNEKDFEIVYLKKKFTYYEQMLGILQHDAYHLGQIALIKKLF